MVAREEGEFVLATDLVARLMAQTCRQSGLSVVYTELLDFDGDEIYFADEPRLAGKTFGDALFAFEDSAAIGIVPDGGTPMLNPPMETLIRSGDQIIAVPSVGHWANSSLACATISRAPASSSFNLSGVRPRASRRAKSQAGAA